MLPFTREQFPAVFVAYNEAVSPIQLLASIEAGVLRGRLASGRYEGWTGWMGWALMAYACIGYPLLGQISGSANLAPNAARSRCGA